MIDKTKLKIAVVLTGIFLVLAALVVGVVLGILVHTQGLKL